MGEKEQERQCSPSFSPIWLCCAHRAEPAMAMGDTCRKSSPKHRREEVVLCWCSLPSCTAFDELCTAGNQLHRYLGIYAAGHFLFLNKQFALFNFCAAYVCILLLGTCILLFVIHSCSNKYINVVRLVPGWLFYFFSCMVPNPSLDSHPPKLKIRTTVQLLLPWSLWPCRRLAGNSSIVVTVAFW